MLKESLIKLGFSEEEAKVYLACLELGSGTAESISQKTGIDKLNTYLTLDVLLGRGLLSSLEKGKISFYYTEDPKRILDYFKNKEGELRGKINLVETLIPELISIVGAVGMRPRVRFFEGAEGLCSFQRDFMGALKGRGEIVYAILPFDEFYGSGLADKVESAKQVRKKRKIKMKVIYTSRKGRQLAYEKEEKKFLKELKFVSYDKFPFRGGMNVHGNKVFLIDYSGKSNGVVIENETIAHMLRSVFEMAWSGI